LTEVRTRHALLVKNKVFTEEQTHKQSGAAGENQAQPVMIREESDDEDIGMNRIPASNPNADTQDELVQDDKKKLLLNTTYDGFNIWGFVLCLLVERQGGQVTKAQGKDGGSAQALMEEWISTQQAQNDEP
jgi:hypothetical protein